MNFDRLCRLLAWLLALALLLLLVKCLCFPSGAPEPYVRQTPVPPQSWAARLLVDEDTLPPASLLDSARSNVFVFLDSWGVSVNGRTDLKISGVRPQKLSRASFAESHWLPGLVARALEIGMDTCYYMQSNKNHAWTLAVDSLLARPGRHLILLTDSNLRMHLKDSADYFRALNSEMKLLSGFAARHPDVRLIIQGNHEPGLAPRGLRALFFRRYVPFAVLN